MNLKAFYLVERHEDDWRVWWECESLNEALSHFQDLRNAGWSCRLTCTIKAA